MRMYFKVCLQTLCCFALTGRSKEIIQDLRNKRIVDLHRSGLSLGAISKCLKVPRSSVQIIARKYKHQEVTARKLPLKKKKAVNGLHVHMGTKMVLFGELSFGLRRCLAIMTVMFGGKIVTPESTLPTVKNGVLGCRTSKNRWHQEDGILHVNISRQHLKTSARKLQMDNDSKHTSKIGLRTTESTYWTGNHKALTSS